LQALSNGLYKSVWHRAIVNADKPRLSVASFLCPGTEALICPAKPLTENGTGAVYRGFSYAEYYSKFWSRNLDQEHCLEFFKTNQP
jgi:isopenicillin N synthase-like dioxygenase